MRFSRKCRGRVARHSPESLGYLSFYQGIDLTIHTTAATTTTTVTIVMNTAGKASNGSNWKNPHNITIAITKLAKKSFMMLFSALDSEQLTVGIGEVVFYKIRYTC